MYSVRDQYSFSVHLDSIHLYICYCNHKYMRRYPKIPSKILEKIKNRSVSLNIPFLMWVIFICCGILQACQSSSGSKTFGDALIEADIRYLQHNGELTATWSFFQRNQKDSLIPDAQRHDFVINGQKAQSEKVKNNYHMYLVTDSFISRNLNVQIGPDNQVFTLDIPDVPEMRPQI